MKIPQNLENAHRLVKRTHKALTHDTYLHHGLVQGRSGDKPLSVEVSPEQIERALRIMDAIIRGAVEHGGRFEQGPESWRWRLVMGKQSVWFHITEARKRLTIDLDDEEREAKGLSRWEKYEWKGAGLLRFRISGDKYVNERFWAETKRIHLEDCVSEIIECLARVEREAEENRTQEAERKKVEAEEQRRRNIEWRKQLEEEERRKRLEKAGEQWQHAQQLRAFIRVCESELRKSVGELPSESRAAQWLVWARAHADRIDPLSQGYLVNLIKSVHDTKANEQE